MIKPESMLFVGEERSERAKQLNVRWEDGALAAKQLFDALRGCDIDPAQVTFTNLFEYGGRVAVRRWGGTVIGMGQKVCKELNKMGVSHRAMVHPAARGKIRKKERYTEHVRETLCGGQR